MKRNNNILIIANALITPESIGGGDRFSIEIISRLADYNINVITTKAGYHHWAKIKNERIVYHILPKNPFDGNQSPLEIFLAYLFRSRKTIPLLKKLPQPDIIISATEFISDVFPCFWYKIKHPHVRWISLFFHLVPPPYKRKGKLLINLGAYLLQKLSLLLLRSSSLLLIDNPNLFKELEKQGILQERMKLNFGGVDINKISLYKPDGQPFAAVCVGGISAHKGTFDIVKVWQRVTAILPDATLAVVGYGPKPDRKKLRQQIQSSSLQKSIKIFGFLPHQKNTQMPLFDVLKNARILLFPDHEAGFGLVIAEAMACGLPVVAYNLPIFGSVYQKGFLTAPLGNTNQFAIQVTKLLRNRRLYQTLSKQAKKQAKAFDWEIAVNKFSTILQNYL